MIKKLVHIDGALGLIMDPDLLERLGFDADTALEVQAEGRALVIRAASDAHRAQVRSATSRMMTHHESALKKLAR